MSLDEINQRLAAHLDSMPPIDPESWAKARFIPRTRPQRIAAGVALTVLALRVLPTTLVLLVTLAGLVAGLCGANVKVTP